MDVFNETMHTYIYATESGNSKKKAHNSLGKMKIAITLPLLIMSKLISPIYVIRTGQRILDCEVSGLNSVSYLKRESIFKSE